MYCFFKLVFLTLTLVGLTISQVIEPGQCRNNVNVQQNFNVDDFLNGTWLEWARTPHPSVEGDCSSYEFFTSDNNDTYAVNNVVINNNFYKASFGNVTIGEDDGILKWNLETIDDEEIDYYVLMTDYSNYALTYACKDVDNNNRAIYFWKLSREPEYSGPLMNDLMNTHISTNFEIDAEEVMVQINHSEQACYELPEIEPGQPILIDGECDDIPGIQDFDVARFLGRWHEIASYASENAQGSCPTAQYSLLDEDTVGVQNSEVIDQELRTISGTAVIASIDNSGVLNVTLEVAPGILAVSELKILTTDYDNYAISYTCLNQPDTNQRRVFSWILGKQKQLSSESQAAVSEFIDTIVDLNDNYYISSDQSDEGCFYYPDHVENQTVVFPGSCNFSDGAMDNFDLQEFLGTWNDIEAYPSDSLTGTCNKFEFTNSSGVILAAKTQVSDELLQSINGVASLVTDDGRGIIEITIPGSGDNDPTTRTFVVVATDYNSYALMYTCFDLPDGEREVWSVKLSRTKSLSETELSSINNAMASVNILDQRYYQNLTHDANNCFYYPEYVPGRTVVFPGICNEDIAVVQGFDLDLFDGVWHEIESYPRDELERNCVNHRYSAANESMDVTSNHIRNQDLYVSNSLLQFDSTDGSGKFNLIINSDTTIPVWILGVDYNDYALAYSCLQIDEDWRIVYSWKLSREKELSTAASLAINEITSEIQVLRPFPNSDTNVYYERVDQSDSACFYLPDLIPGEPMVFFGQCSESIQVMRDFDPEAYTGRWRLIESYPAQFETGSCNDANYTLEGDVVIVHNTQVVDERLDTITGTAVIASDDGSGKLEVTFPIAGTNMTVTSQLWILDTDYETYSLAYSCVNLTTDSRQVWSWKLSRTPELNETAIERMNEIIDSVDVLNSRYFLPKDHTDSGCFYYPEEDPTKPVTFRGRCDLDIAAMPDFNVEDYLGFWHEIERYPSTFQFGTCNNANYSANGDVVSVYNTQVINQTLDFVNGQAVLASTDGSAKLIVTFPIAGTDQNVSINYWVLDTDYFNYAIVYTCEETGDDERTVFSWKLSRTRELSEEANTNINAVINRVQVLDQRYYLASDQSDQGCFYYPEVTGRPVFFRGRCSDNVYTVSNISLELLSGTWYEIAAYPKMETSEGECLSYDYTVSSDDSLDFIAKQVIGLDLDSTSARLQLTTDNGEAKFNLTINVDNEQIVIPYWILATDYENYAYAYSCVEIDEYHRGIWSWKLSRNKSGLTDNAQAAIEGVMSEVEVLRERYYESSDLSDTACFYLPDITRDEPAIFPGRCNVTIPTVQDFDPDRYQGRWYDIQSYFDAFQNGTCNDAQYTLTVDGIVEVYNTMVVEESLETINGTAVTTDESGKLIVNFPIVGTNITTSSNYWILDTDYDNYSLVYSCTDFPDDTRRVYSWKLSRTRELSEFSETMINAIIEGIDVLEDRYYIRRDHTEDGCFYFPEHDPFREAVFRGRCNDDIPVVESLNIEDYSGLWFDVSSYPSRFQTGTCPNLRYTFIDSANATVDQSQVSNQELQQITGYIQVESIENAKFQVTYPIPNTNDSYTIPHWVLATDYENYALVYSCMNIDNEYYTVNTWKLSREITLNDDSETAIADAMSDIRVLDDRYFVDRSHSAESCFYYPENNGGPVVLDGVCSTEQNVVTGFDINRFTGTWHEIARFPSDQQTGDCPSSEFAYNSQTLTISHNIIYNERLTQVRGTLTASDDGLGILTGFMDNPSGGEPIEVTIYILDTDYDEYALLYSCVNLNTNNDVNQKQIFSWKLSRTASGLSDDANANIDAIVTDNIDLFERYYEYSEHDRDTCFYYPEYDDTASAIELPGFCDERIQAIPDFNVPEYLGRWFEVARYPQQFEEGQCARATYTLDEGRVRVFNEIVNNRILETIVGSAEVASDDGSGLLNVIFEVNGVEVQSNYYVLSTDYDNYALVYSCRNLTNGNRLVSSWKLSRERTLDDQYNSIMDPIITNTQGLLEDYYRSTSQSDADCFYVPEVNEGEDVLFRENCETISGVTNFDVQRYSGVWHEIESYSTSEDRGKCIRSDIQTQGNEYLAVDSSVYDLAHAVNTSTLEVSEDGRITRVNSDGETSTIWVLATDYDNYALLFSCENVADEYRRVWSAKLSRTQQRPSDLDETLAPIIEGNDLLYNHLYLAIDQSEDACFYVPERVDNEDVIFRGRCESVTGVQNFNAQRYMGWWHEIDSYPTSEDRGTCISSDIRSSGNQYIVVDTGVFGLEAVTATNTLQVTNDGRLIRMLANGDTSVVWVLATDYDNYALLYSCEQIDDEHRRVWSAKHSKLRELSQPAENSITPIIEENRVLYDQLYAAVDQSDEACFHYPAQTEQRVILPGRCDLNIPVVQNFDVVRYTGTWYQIERYPQIHESGTCTGARYTLDEERGVVTVLNWEVVDGELNEIEGTATVASTDGSAKLTVSLPVGNTEEMTETSLYVLATDYNTYSLAYSCQDIDNFRRSVGVWKLSRTRTMLSAGNTAINTIINQRQELHQPYFIQVEHNEDCAEPNSSILLSSSLLMIIVTLIVQRLF